MRKSLLALLNNRPQLLLLVLFLGTLPFLRWAAAILLALVTLRQGAKVGAQLVLALIVPTLLLLFFDKVALVPVISQCIETLTLFGLACLLRSSYSWVLLLQVLVVVGLGVVLIVHWTTPDIVSTWVRLLKPSFIVLGKAFPMLALPDDAISPWLERLAYFSTGLEVCVLSLMALGNCALGRYLQAVLYNPGGLKLELYVLRLTPLFASGLVGFLLVAFLSRQAWMLDCVAVMVLPLALSALSLCHYLTARLKWQALWLVLGYVTLFLFPPQLLLVLISISFVDAWWNIRQHYALKR